MQNETTSWCKNCRSYFYYHAPYPNGRKREYCDKCIIEVRRQSANERKRRQRQRESQHRQSGGAKRKSPRLAKAQSLEQISAPCVGGRYTPPQTAHHRHRRTDRHDPIRYDPQIEYKQLTRFGAEMGRRLPPHTNKGGSNPL